MSFGLSPEVRHATEHAPDAGACPASILAFWLYASRSRLSRETRDAEVARIVEISSARNPPLRITGALLFTGERFAQYLEGPPLQLTELRASIERDERHREIVTIEEGEGEERRFAGWSLAYAGPALYVAPAIERPLAAVAAGTRDGADQLIRLMREFAGDGQG